MNSSGDIAKTCHCKDLSFNDACFSKLWRRIKVAVSASDADGHPIVSPRTASLYHRHASLEDHMQAAFSDEDASPQHAWDESHMDVQHLVEAASPPLAPSSELLGMPFCLSVHIQPWHLVAVCARVCVWHACVLRTRVSVRSHWMPVLPFCMLEHESSSSSHQAVFCQSP